MVFTLVSVFSHPPVRQFNQTRRHRRRKARRPVRGVSTYRLWHTPERISQIGLRKKQNKFENDKSRRKLLRDFLYQEFLKSFISRTLPFATRLRKVLLLRRKSSFSAIYIILKHIDKKAELSYNKYKYCIIAAKCFKIEKNRKAEVCGYASVNSTTELKRKTKQIRKIIDK